MEPGHHGYAGTHGASSRREAGRRALLCQPDESTGTATSAGYRSARTLLAMERVTRMTDLHAEASANTPLSPANETVNARVSIVVLTFNRRDEVLHTLGKLVALSERPPIVVVDNASSDGSCEAIKRNFPQIAMI